MMFKVIVAVSLLLFSNGVESKHVVGRESFLERKRSKQAAQHHRSAQSHQADSLKPDHHTGGVAMLGRQAKTKRHKSLAEMNGAVLFFAGLEETGHHFMEQLFEDNPQVASFNRKE
mmetsp:Transcript_6659/g.14538  ORF Transcript_6659/g.14538 Transcript_6659/m.14538 type:complete len:116 (+) Transcript_6659:181-528(+)